MSIPFGAPRAPGYTSHVFSSGFEKIPANNARKMKAIHHSSPKAQQALLTIESAVADSRFLSLVTYTLSNYGEFLLHHIAATILGKYGRSDLLDIVYPAAKELIINATKANLKRIFFEEQKIDPTNPAEYDRGMELFKEQLSERILRLRRQEFVDRGFSITTTFYYSPRVLNIKVKNSFKLLPREEERIRSKFERARSFTNLLDFYMTHGDNTEGAGLGITMVGLMLDQSGIDRHGFTVFVKPGYNETAARLEIPLSDDYVPRRKQFDAERRRTGLSALELRQTFKPVFVKE